MSTLMQASTQWASRPADERFTSLQEMSDHFARIRSRSASRVVSSRHLRAHAEDMKNLVLVGPDGNAAAPTHWAFGQLAQRAEAPSGYLRTLPAPIAADCVNYGLQFKRDIEDIGVLLYKNGSTDIRAITGPNYGRIWNEEIVKHLVHRFGDGVTGEWCVPGMFGKRLDEVTKGNTTLFAGDRDMFVFLADEQHRIENPARGGEPMARGFFVWNSEVGSSTFGMATFLFDYVCCNRIVWGAAEYKQITIRHTASAPDKYMEEMQPALTAYANSSARTITHALQAAKETRMDEKLAEFMANRFGKRIWARMEEVHQNEEGRPVENLWDATTAATAYARGIKYQDERVDVEKRAGDLLDLALKSKAAD